MQVRGNNTSSNGNDNGNGDGDGGVLAIGSSDRRRRRGPQPTARQTLESLAQCAAADGRLHEAKDLWQRAVSLRELEAGGAGPKSDRADEAEAPFWLMPVAKASGEERSGAHDPHPPAVEKLDLLGKRAMEEGRTDDALELLRRALELRQTDVGDEHLVEVAKTLYYLGRCELDQGRLDEAERLENHALRIQEKTLGDEHPDVAATRVAKEEIKQKREFFFR